MSAVRLKAWLAVPLPLLLLVLVTVGWSVSSAAQNVSSTDVIEEPAGQLLAPNVSIAAPNVLVAVPNVLIATPSLSSASISASSLSMPTSSSVQWSALEKAILQGLLLKQLPQPSPNPSNTLVGLQEAQRLGLALFSDVRLSGSGNVACATCHQPRLCFTDGLTTAKGAAVLTKNTPTLLGVSHNYWFYFDGRRDSLWAQALTPIEALDEMGGSRIAVAQLILADDYYAKAYRALLGAPAVHTHDLPDYGGPYSDALGRKQWRFLSASLKDEVNQIFANVGRFIAAYERTLQPASSRIDQYIETVLAENLQPIIPVEAQRGLRLFIDVNKTQCLKCHNGPLFSNGGFHNVGTIQTPQGLIGSGRFVGLHALIRDEFNCWGRYSGVAKAQCQTLNHVDFNDSHSALYGALKVPTLRGLSATAPYGHRGQFPTLEAVVRYYNAPPSTEKMSHELTPLGLTPQEIDDLVSFLKLL